MVDKTQKDLIQVLAEEAHVDRDAIVVILEKLKDEGMLKEFADEPCILKD